MRRALVLGLVALAVAACAGVLGLRRASAPKVFPHRAHVVASVACTKCHPNIDNEQILHIPDDASCLSCHDKPHDRRSCTGCHAPDHALERLADAKDHLIFDHARHLGADVAKGNCMRCHVGVADGDDRMRPPMAACFKCHDSNARTCETCHRDLPESGTLPASHLAHDGDWIREHGTRASSSGELCETCHRQSFCASCHGATVPAIPATLRPADPFSPSVHRAGFAARHSLEARSDPGACTTCHAPDRCASCHVARGVAGEGRGNPHPPGWVGLTSSENLHGREARRDPAACASCHGGAGEKLCVSCHAVGGIGGNPHPPGFSSRQPLSALPCRLCHPLGAR